MLNQTVQTKIVAAFAALFSTIIALGASVGPAVNTAIPFAI